MAQVKVGDRIASRTIMTIHQHPLVIPAATGLTHLQFRRYAGCPVCNLHLRQVTSRLDELLESGITEVAFFYSPLERMLPYQGDLPFAAVADPERNFYREFGVEKMTARDIAANAFNVKAWIAVAKILRDVPDKRGAMGPGEAKLGLPADFLIDPSGAIVAAHYGRSVDDHWSVDAVLERAAANSMSGG